MFPLPLPLRPLTPTPTTSSSLPPTAPILNTLYTSLLRPALLPPPEQFTQPLLDSFVTAHDPLLENETLFTASSRLREVSVEVDRIVREFRRAAEEPVVGVGIGWKEVREGRRTGNMGRREGEKDVRERARERIEKFEAEIKKEEEEALKGFKEGLRKAVGVSRGDLR